MTPRYNSNTLNTLNVPLSLGTLGLIIAGLITFNNVNNDSHLLYLLPLTYTLFVYIQKEYYGKIKNLAYNIINIIAFLRYVFIPLLWSMTTTYNGAVATGVDYDQAILTMCFELLCISVCLRISCQYLINKSDRFSNLEGTSNSIYAYIIVCIGFVIAMLLYDYLRDKLFNFNYNVGDIVLDKDEATHIYWAIPTWARIVSSAGKHVSYSIIVLYVNKWIRLRKPKLIVLIVLSLFYLSSLWFAGSTVSRWELLMGLVVITEVFTSIFNEYRKRILYIMGGIILFVLFFGSIMKLATFSIFDNQVTSDDVIDYYFNPEMTDEYFSGIGPVANGIKVCEIYDGTPFDFFSDFFGPVALVGRFFTDYTYCVPNDYYHIITGHEDLIIPTVGMSQLAFGSFFSPLYSCILCVCAIFMGNQISKRRFLCDKVLFIIPAFWLSLFMCVNPYIIMNAIYSSFYVMIFVRVMSFFTKLK